MQEIWKDIIIDNKNTGWKVSNLGRCMRRDGSITTGITTSDGYKQVRINYKTIRVHRLVGEYFIPNPENKPKIDHINTNRVDNRVDNLRWCTQKENVNNPVSKEKYLKNVDILHKNKYKKVQCVETGEIFISAREASKKYNLGKCSVCNAANPNIKKRSTAGGYHWKYLS